MYMNSIIYPIIDKLNKNLKNLFLKDFKNVIFYPYVINKKETTPFITILLQKYKELNDFNFIKLNITKNEYYKCDIQCYFDDYIKKIVQQKDIDFNGYYYYDDKIYLFYNLTNCSKIINYDPYFSDNGCDTCLCTLSEIINDSKIYNININKEAYDFLIKNSELLFLKDKNNIPYEIPVIGYVGTSRKNVKFNYIFGATSCIDGIMGSYYYFTNYTNAIQQASNNGGIIRFAIFLGDVFVKLNSHPKNRLKYDIDNSIIKQKLLIDDSNEAFTMRVTDYDGKWALERDSLYLGVIELDNGFFMKNTPLYVLKNINQHVSLSYHYV